MSEGRDDVELTAAVSKNLVLTKQQKRQLGELLDKVREFFVDVLRKDTSRKWDDGTQSEMKIELGTETYTDDNETILMAHVSVKHKENL